MVLLAALSAGPPATCPPPTQAGSYVPGHGPGPVATFSIVAADPKTHQVGVAVASRFFAVGSVVPWARAGSGALATQAFANTSFGPYGLVLMQQGLDAKTIVKNLLAGDDQPERRQLGVVTADGGAAAHTGSGCTPWAGQRTGNGYAIQGNILRGEGVVEAMERAYLDTPGSLARRLHTALAAGDAAGGDARGHQSAALVVARPGGGYGGYSDRYIDIRVDDHADPLAELGRLLDIAEVNGLWNLAWTAYTQERLAEALPLMERTAGAARAANSAVLPEVLYDLAIVQAHSGHEEEALVTLQEAVAANPGLAGGARDDEDMAPLRRFPAFRVLVKPPAPAGAEEEESPLCPVAEPGEGNG
jgi:uncharacterized Ntn-hydrolase superfamily protein